ncbi:hypothetical protein BD779DRAFT_162627 [Infundibulicybe gibba]|nr:hypothetical protein BD779DRAFT_162627 [Infundibulicybe gibba]
MGQFFDELPDFPLEWVVKQNVLWVGSSPLDLQGYWYEDSSGSGMETRELQSYLMHLRVPHELSGFLGKELFMSSGHQNTIKFCLLTSTNRGRALLLWLTYHRTVSHSALKLKMH